MASAVEYDVVPSAGLWALKLAGDSQTELFAIRSEALARAKQLAQRHSAARVRILDENGRVDEVLEFGHATGVAGPR